MRVFTSWKSNNTTNKEFFSSRKASGPAYLDKMKISVSAAGLDHEGVRRN